MRRQWKADQLVRKRKENGLWYWDEDFEGDTEEMYVYVRDPKKIQHWTDCEESAEATIRDSGNAELANVLLEEGGMLGPGNMPAVDAQNQKALLSALTPVNPVTKPKPIKANKEPEVLKPKEVWECGQEKLEMTLKAAGEARKHAISLGHVEYGGALVSELMDFSVKMEQLYSELQPLVLSKVNDESKYQATLKRIEGKLEWFNNKAKAAAQALQRGLKEKKAKAPKSAKSAKASGGEKSSAEPAA
ncbi:unnamed protein product [Effrenium voratum]|uniref:Uncharacterized protein n=1 Tax=Effrenium voratum TaxID=2562239 RepID=A0AA36MV69_9DINO|nr:unnamed protein product [Effrenium voratum]